MVEAKDVLRPTDDDARALARGLMDAARFAALAVVTEEGPQVSRVALATTPEGLPVSLVSGLALHTRALAADPRAGLLIGEPGQKGDPLTHPRLSLSATARFIARGAAEHEALRAHWMALRPKSTLYVDLPDFRFVVFTPTGASLNGGFGRAFRLTAEDLR
ncbi:pyridoxamine 5-phosphate oxidase [Haematobacter missouriensis]|uniref:Pyridoxamine 5-phosphate oxidase n=1 Tax=Haematobacter missouriensis TaxID=366616 RepID=A0A212AUA6_9RHOB|nr:pyridoxamine 5'-phosphate oxidase family protein [Haematobacter missouriensis]KFI33385.1 pyridoxamine 5-phosphate oxidase [Haematobacter missouriensis]OWJ77210.1 pyridoxamine 5-phosphate oxidase [Haematobacter missouriensis]OWJ85067.1 pyridoxamine 5-phosphate oxidase [Haematobacter missouriensis]